MNLELKELLELRALIELETNNYLEGSKRFNLLCLNLDIIEERIKLLDK